LISLILSIATNSFLPKEGKPDPLIIVSPHPLMNSQFLSNSSFGACPAVRSGWRATAWTAEIINSCSECRAPRDRAVCDVRSQIPALTCPWRIFRHMPIDPTNGASPYPVLRNEIPLCIRWNLPSLYQHMNPSPKYKTPLSINLESRGFSTALDHFEASSALSLEKRD